MNKQIIIFIVSYVLMLTTAFFLKIFVVKTAEKAIEKKRLCTGIYRLFPVEGERAVKLAKGYISGMKITFWFSVFFLPMLFVLAVLNGTI